MESVIGQLCCDQLNTAYTAHRTVARPLASSYFFDDLRWHLVALHGAVSLFDARYPACCQRLLIIWLLWPSFRLITRVWDQAVSVVIATPALACH